MKKCIMAVMAHADDMEIVAGGTMAKFADQGYEAALVMLTANMAGAATAEKGYRETTPEETMPIRERETRRAAEILGVRRLEWLRFQESQYSDGRGFVVLGDDAFNPRYPGVGPLLPAVAINPRLVGPLQELIAACEPEILIMQHPISGFEHVCAGHIVNLAFRQAMEKGAALGQLWMPMQVRHCSWASDLRLYPSPNILIDISAYWEKKAQAILAHESQGLAAHMEEFRTIARYWGMARQCEYAEPFFTLCDGRYR